MDRYGLHGKVIAVQGKRDALVEFLLEAARLVGSAPGCELYIVATSPSEPEVVWVTEVWRSKADHQDSLSVPGVKELIAKARPLMESFGERFETVPVGGKGLAPH